MKEIENKLWKFQVEKMMQNKKEPLFVKYASTLTRGGDKKMTRQEPIVGCLNVSDVKLNPVVPPKSFFFNKCKKYPLKPTSAFITKINTNGKVLSSTAKIMALSTIMKDKNAVEVNMNLEHEFGKAIEQQATCDLQPAYKEEHSIE